MDSTILADALRGLDFSKYSWKFALYSTQKTRDGLELEWNLCNMNDIDEQVEIIRDYLLKKPVADKPVAQYSPFYLIKKTSAH